MVGDSKHKARSRWFPRTHEPSLYIDKLRVVSTSDLQTFPVYRSLFLFKLGSGHLKNPFVLDLLRGPQAAPSLAIIVPCATCCGILPNPLPLLRG